MASVAGNLAQHLSVVIRRSGANTMRSARFANPDIPAYNIDWGEPTYASSIVFYDTEEELEEAGIDGWANAFDDDADEEPYYTANRNAPQWAHIVNRLDASFGEKKAVT